MFQLAEALVKIKTLLLKINKSTYLDINLSCLAVLTNKMCKTGNRKGEKDKSLNIFLWLDEAVDNLI